MAFKIEIEGYSQDADEVRELQKKIEAVVDEYSVSHANPVSLNYEFNG